MTIRACGTLFALLLAVHATVAAQGNLGFSLRPGLMKAGDDYTGGLHYALDLVGTPRFSARDPTKASRFQTAFAWEAHGAGAAALKSSATTEPLTRIHAATGFRVQRAETGGCPPGSMTCMPADDADWGYLFSGLRLALEAGPAAREIEGALGVSLLYRSRLSAPTGLWPLMPSASVDLDMSRPLRSQLRDSLGIDLGPHGRVAFALVWDRLKLNRAPDLVSRFRLEAEWRHFREFGLADSLRDATIVNGTFIALGAAYEFTGLVPYFRGLSVQWSDGEHPTQKEERKAWRIGVAFSNRR